MKGLIKARGICVRISIAHGHRATQGLHALLAALLAVADRALCTHTALPMPCYLKNGINEPRSWSGRPWCHSSSRRAIGCCPIRAARPLRTSSTTYSASAARDEVDRCAAASSASRRAACPTATSSSCASPQHGPTSARPQRESERRAWTSATRTTMWARAVRRVSVVYAAGRV